MQTFADIFTPALTAFLIGVFFATTIFASFTFAVFLFLLGAVLLIYHLILRPKSLHFIVIGALFIMCGIGVFRYTSWKNAPIDSVLAAHVGTMVAVHATIIAEPDAREKNTHLIVSLDQMKTREGTTTLHGTALIIVPAYPTYAYGEKVLVYGKMTIPEAFTGDDGRTFDYPEYLHAKGVRFQFVYPRMNIEEGVGGNFMLRGLLQLKDAFTEQIEFVLPEPESALAEGLLLGGGHSLGDEWTTRFRDVGLIHIVVLSGYNMTIVAEWLAVSFLFLGFYPSIAVASIGIVLFTLMTGAGATVVRAAIMALLVLLARLTGRNYDVGRGLLFAGVMMVIFDPGILVHDPSFQLSFLAALGLLYITPLLKPYLRGLQRFPILEEVVVSTIATQALVLPLLIYQTGIVSLIALFSNILVLPLIPLTMFFAFLGSLVGFASTLLASVVMLPAHLMLLWMLVVAKYGAMIPFASLRSPAVSGQLVVGIYVLVALYLLIRHKKRTNEFTSSLHQALSE